MFGLLGMRPYSGRAKNSSDFLATSGPSVAWTAVFAY